MEGVRLGEVDGDLVGGELVIDLGHSVDFAFNLFSVEGVEVNLDVFLSIEGDSGALASDRSGVALININFNYYDIFQSGGVNSGKSSASGSLLASVSLGCPVKNKAYLSWR